MNHLVSLAHQIAVNVEALAESERLRQSGGTPDDDVTETRRCIEDMLNQLQQALQRVGQ